MGLEGSHPEFPFASPSRGGGLSARAQYPCGFSSLLAWRVAQCAPSGARVEGGVGAMGLLLVLLVPARPFVNRETESSRWASSEVPQLGGSSSLGADLGLTGSPARASALAAPCGGSWQGGWAGNSAEGPAGSTFLDKGGPTTQQWADHLKHERERCQRHVQPPTPHKPRAPWFWLWEWRVGGPEERLARCTKQGLNRLSTPAY